MKSQIVLVDDETAILESLRRTLRPFRAGWEVLTFHCPRTAWEHLRSTGADTVVSDLRMPGMDGLQLLSLMQEHPQTKDIPFIILTGAGDRDLRRKALESSATDLLNKPADTDELIARLRNGLRLKSFQDELKGNNARLEQAVAERTQELTQSRLEVIWRLAKAAEFRDEETGNHVIRVAAYSRAVAQTLGLGGQFIQQLFLTAPLHDIGKIGIPDAILRKPGKLDDAEWTIMKQHCAIGARILQDDCRARRAFHTLSGSDVLGERRTDSLVAMASSIALTHHEKWNGGGYPQNLAGEAIPLEARIVAIADVYDALTSERPYKAAFPHSRALAIIAEGNGKHFDPAVYEAFAASLPKILDLKAELTDHANGVLNEEVCDEACAVCG